MWPIEERAVPQSDVPGEWTAPTQPFPVKPAPYDRQGVTKSDLVDYTPELRGAMDEFLRNVRLGAMYAPASLANAADGTVGTLSLPSPVGGAHWEGGAYDPSSGLLYVPSMTLAVVLQLEHDPAASDVAFIAGGSRPPLLMGLPLIKPPWGRITAIDLMSGEYRFMIPNSDTPPEIANNPQSDTGLFQPKQTANCGFFKRGSAVSSFPELYGGERGRHTFYFYHSYQQVMDSFIH